MHKNGITGTDWRIIKELNNNLSAQIRTNDGLTRKIQIKDSIRQGGVLSVIEYANLMDEIAKEIQHRKTGTQKIWEKSSTGCLLWMDDVALIHHEPNVLQNMLNITDDIAKRYHIKFGTEKSQVLTIGKPSEKNNFNLGNITLDNTDTYNYLGMILNSHGSSISNDNIVSRK
jgi:hypothetical protein